MSTTPPAFATAAEHLAAHLDWLRELLAWQVDVTRSTFGALAADEYRGLYVPDAEVELLRSGPTGLAEPLVTRRNELAKTRAELAAAEAASVAAGVHLPLVRLARLFDL